jgi:hypothetical protein
MTIIRNRTDNLRFSFPLLTAITLVARKTEYPRYTKVINMAFLPDELIHYITDDSLTVTDGVIYK